MTRAFVHRALALAVRSSGESNRDATFLTADAGLIRATVFGGPKSRLRAVVAPFHDGELHIYHDPVRDSRKVTDFDVATWRPGLRELLERSYAAQAVAETVIFSHAGGGAWEKALSLVSSSLDAIETADAAGSKNAFIRFLWKWTELLGARVETDECSICACVPRSDEVVWYSRREGTLACGRCADPPSNDGDSIPLGPGARAWLNAVDRADARSALRIGADEGSTRQARAFVLAVAVQAIGERLKTWTFLDQI
jgi:DNA repair protein RecO (recombination protein O)